MPSDRLRKLVYDQYGEACVICGRNPEGWRHCRKQEELSLHHIDGDETNDEIENLIPVCQSCHKLIHRLDRPPYRFYHRQLPHESRNAINQHTSKAYEGPRLTRQKAIEKHGNETAKPESTRYEKYEDWEFNPSEYPLYYHSIS
ncbi:HNH endonuclease (plasmid) [Halorientalis pallida]|uniref:HNH endonuclease n=1 Tax=Halorientalis pallida TaxID=2479928 RepID=UPI003C6F4F9D